jgi:hypothetical protein
LSAGVGVGVVVGETEAFALTSEPLWEAASTGTARVAAARRRLKAKPDRCFRKGIGLWDAARLFEEGSSITMR